MPSAPESFYQQIQGARNVLVLDLGFLGDTIHLIPALHCIREALPQARLTVMAGEHIKSILRVCPWLDAVVGYPRFPTSPGLGWHLGFLKKMRAARYDAVINLNGSDRSAILTRLSGATLRLGRVPPKVAWFWPKCFSYTVQVPFKGPLYRQRWECLKQCGFPGDAPVFAVEVPAQAVSHVNDLCDGRKDFVHLSPFATQDNKELLEESLVSLIDLLHEKGMRIALSCAPNERELNKLEALLGKVEKRPWKVFDGTLNLLELAALIQRSDIHLGGDSGALHVALMVGARTVSWWRDYKGRDEWMPVGDKHVPFIGRETDRGLDCIVPGHVLNEIDLLLSR